MSPQQCWSLCAYAVLLFALCLTKVPAKWHGFLGIADLALCRLWRFAGCERRSTSLDGLCLDSLFLSSRSWTLDVISFCCFFTFLSSAFNRSSIFFKSWDKNFLLSMSNSVFPAFYACVFLHKCGIKQNLTFRKQKFWTLLQSLLFLNFLRCASIISFLSFSFALA